MFFLGVVIEVLSCPVMQPHMTSDAFLTLEKFLPTKFLEEWFNSFELIVIWDFQNSEFTNNFHS